MRLIDLTLPLFEGMGIGNCYPTERSFEIEPIVRWEDPRGIRLETYSMYAEQGTRFVLPSAVRTRKDETKIDEVDLKDIVFRDTVVIDIPKEANEAITVEEVESACVRADFREGDALLVRTGWGDVERLDELGDDYELTTPYFLDEACARIVEILRQKKSNLFCFDTANMGNWKFVKAEWCSRKPRPSSWPSPEARKFVAEVYSKRIIPPEGEWATRLAMAGIMQLGVLANCMEIKKERVKLIILPLRVRGAVMSPCHVVAVEE